MRRSSKALSSQSKRVQLCHGQTVRMVLCFILDRTTCDYLFPSLFERVKGLRQHQLLNNGCCWWSQSGIEFYNSHTGSTAVQLSIANSSLCSPLPPSYLV